MDETEKNDLQRMIKANNVDNNTELIRQTGESQQIWKNVNTLLNLMNVHKEMHLQSPAIFKELCQKTVPFLHTKYNIIFDKVINKEINLDILLKMINKLKHIEEGGLDQHEASFEVGKLLKVQYIDKVLNENENENENININISWNEYSKQQLNVQK
jgi:hypothetical protein